MSKNNFLSSVLWASFGTDVSENVMQYAIHFAKIFGSSIDSFYVVPTTYNQEKSECFTETEKQLNAVWLEFSSKENINKIKFLQKIIRNENIKTSYKIMQGIPCYEILKFAEDRSVDLIVMDRGIKMGGKCIIQKTTLYIVNNSNIPVLTANDSSEFRTIKNILVPVYIHNINSSSFNFALNLSKSIDDCTITLLNINDPSLPPEVVGTKHGDAYFNLSKSKKKNKNIHTAVIDSENIPEGIMEFIGTKEIDLIVLQTFSGNMEDVFHTKGSIAEELLQMTDCPVITIKTG